MYVFLPLSVSTLSRTQKLNHRVLLVAPKWSTTTWFPLLLLLVIGTCWLPLRLFVSDERRGVASLTVIPVISQWTVEWQTARYPSTDFVQNCSGNVVCPAKRTWCAAQCLVAKPRKPRFLNQAIEFAVINLNKFYLWICTAHEQLYSFILNSLLQTSLPLLYVEEIDVNCN